jgi:hypothetical protein
MYMRMQYAYVFNGMGCEPRTILEMVVENKT